LHLVAVIAAALFLATAGAATAAISSMEDGAAINAQVRLRAGHFERWLWLWRTTVDELFAGERAELAKSHAERVARAFHSRLRMLDSQPVRDELPTLTITRHGPA
jgi:hemoglobin